MSKKMDKDVREKFHKWINKKFLDWQNSEGIRKTQVEFARYLGIVTDDPKDADVVRNWMNGRSTPDPIYVTMIANVLDDETIYDILGWQRPKSKKSPPEYYPLTIPENKEAAQEAVSALIRQ